MPSRVFAKYSASSFLPHPAAALMIVAAVAYALLFSWLTLTRYAAFEARALDMGNLNQAIWNTAYGNWFHLTNQPGTVNRLSLHVEPILLPIAALYRLYMETVAPAGQTNAGPAFLVVLQSVVVALGAWPVFALARYLLRNAWLGLVFGLAFLLNPTIQAANWLEFHPVTLAPTFLLAAFYCLLRARVGWFVLFAALAASCKEEIGLLVFMQGVYACFVLGRILPPFLHSMLAVPLPVSLDAARMRRVGAVTMALAMGWSLTAVLVIQNLFADGNIHWGRYGYLGDSPLGMVWTLVSRPQVVLAQLQQAGALGYIHQLWAPFGYLPLFAPHIFLLALPSLGINLLADFAPMHQVNTLIYAAPIMPFAMLAAIVGAARIQRWLEARADGAHSRMAGYAGIVLAVWVLLPAGAQHWAYGYLPTGGNFRLYPITEHHRRATAILEQIPAQAIVSAQDKLNPHVSGRETVYIFPRLDAAATRGIPSSDAPGLADFVWVDVTGPAWPQHPKDLYTMVQELLAGPYVLHSAHDGYLLLARSPATNPPTSSLDGPLHSVGGHLPEPESPFYTAWHAAPPAQTLLAQPVTFGEAVQLVDYAVVTDVHGELVTHLYWQLSAPVQEALGFYVAYRDRAGRTLYDTEFYPPVAQLWYPTDLWPHAGVIRLQTLPWTLEAQVFGLYVGVYRAAGEDDEPPREFLPVTGNPAALPDFPPAGLVRIGGFGREQTSRSLLQALPPHPWQPVVPVVSSPAQPLEARFGEHLALQGVDARRTGQAVTLTLYWEALAQIPADYTFFVHLLNETGTRLAQLDDQPQDAIGPRPMTGWQAGEQIVDHRVILLEQAGGEVIPAGELHAQIGVYHWQDGARLPVAGVHARPGDLIEVVIAEQ